MDEGIESRGMLLSHLAAKAGSVDVLSSESGTVIKLGSGSLKPSAAATALRRAMRMNEGCELKVCSLKVGLVGAYCSDWQLSSFRSCPAQAGIGLFAATNARMGPVVSL